MNWFHIIFSEKSFSSSFEREYCVRHLERREIMLTRYNIHIAMMWTVLSQIILSLSIGPTNPLAIESYIFHSAGFVGLFLLKHHMNQKLRFKHYMTMLKMVGNLFLLSVMLRLDGNNSGSWAVVTIVVIQIVFNLLMLPYRNYIHIVILSIYSAAFGLVAYATEMRPLMIALVIGIFHAASNTQVIVYRLRRYALIADFRDRSRYIPHQLIRSSLNTNMSIAEIYPQDARFCVCLSSDWRGFQKITKQLEPSKIGHLLASYYNEVSALLAAHFPSGNYFYDWIADELFCVIFAPTVAKDSEQVTKAAAFAKELLAMRTRFTGKFGAPLGIDVGIAIGEAVIGVFGPDGQAKATAFGEVPGQSRRIQTLGKSLRTSLGDSDRIIFLNEVAEILRSTDGLEIYECPPVSVADVVDTKFYYFEYEKAKTLPNASSL